MMFYWLFFARPPPTRASPKTVQPPVNKAPYCRIFQLYRNFQATTKQPWPWCISADWSATLGNWQVASDFADMDESKYDVGCSKYRSVRKSRTVHPSIFHGLQLNWNRAMLESSHHEAILAFESRNFCWLTMQRSRLLSG